MTRIECRDIPSGDAANSQQVRLAHDCLVKDGYVILDNVLPADRVRALHLDFNRHYEDYLRDVEHDDSLRVGHRRFRIPLRFSGGFADPDIYANPVVLALIRATLDEDAIIEAYGAVVSLSHADPQHVHRDGPFLFDSGISPLLPAHALTFALPLIDMNDVNGTTALWSGSHRWKARAEDAQPTAAAIPVGSCVIWDFRLFHCGTANLSDHHRPMVYSTYARRWYQDPTGFQRRTQVRLSFDADFIRTVPAQCRGLFSHVADVATR
jgi:hypothetical protein